MCHNKSSGAPPISVCVTLKNTTFKSEITRREAAAKKISFRGFGTETYRFTAAYRKLVEELAFFDVFLIHGSAIAVDG